MPASEVEIAQLVEDLLDRKLDARPGTYAESEIEPENGASEDNPEEEAK